MLLKQKILLAIVLPPAVGLALYAFFVYRITLSDKEAYVFQSTLTLSQTMGQLLRVKLDQAFEEAQSQSENESEIRATFWDLDANRQTKILKQKGRPFKKNIFVLPKVAGGDRVYFADMVEEDGQRYLAFYLKLDAEGRTFASVFMPESQIKPLLTKTTDFHLAVIRQNPPGTLISNTTSDESIHQSGLQTLLESSPGGAGAQELQDEKGRALLVSFSAIPNYPMSVFTSIERDRAFEAARRIAWQTASFCLLLISVSVIVAIFLSKALTRALIQLAQGTKAISEGDFSIHMESQSKDEIGMLTQAFNVMVVKIRNLLEDTAHKARMEGELKTAKTVQELLLPKSENQFGQIQVKGVSFPASECGGDFWYTYETNHFVFCMIGDVTGHGVASALITSAARAVFALAEKQKIEDLTELASLMNTTVYACTKGTRTMTAFFLKVDKTTFDTTYINFSHVPSVIVPARKMEAGQTWRDLPSLSEPINRPLGQRAEIEIATGQTQLAPWQEVLVLTDGVFDAMNPEGKMFGERKTYQSTANYLNTRGAESVAVDFLAKELIAFQKGAEPPDDITIISLKIH